MCYPPEQRTRLDFAQTIRWLVDGEYPEARVICLVMDNLNSHMAASLNEAFPPEEAQRIWQRLEVHYTPKHGSWLNRAEIEISIFERGCLSKRVKSLEYLWHHVLTLAVERNAQGCRIHWRFTCADARAQMHALYPASKLTLHCSGVSSAWCGDHTPVRASWPGHCQPLVRHSWRWASHLRRAGTRSIRRPLYSFSQEGTFSTTGRYGDKKGSE